MRIPWRTPAAAFKMQAALSSPSPPPPRRRKINVVAIIISTAAVMILGRLLFSVVVGCAAAKQRREGTAMPAAATGGAATGRRGEDHGQRRKVRFPFCCSLALGFCDKFVMCGRKKTKNQPQSVSFEVFSPTLDGIISSTQVRSMCLDDAHRAHLVRSFNSSGGKRKNSAPSISVFYCVLRTVSRGASGIDGNSSDFAGSQQSETRLKRSSINLLRLPVCADKSVIPS